MVKMCYVALVLTACLLAGQVYGIGDLETEWEKFQAHFPMSSNNPENIARRKRNFAKTHDEIQKHNSNPDATFEMDFNRFSVMDEEEKKKFIGNSNLFRPDANSRYINDLATDRQLPDSIDLRNHNCIQPVKNQGNCGSCWAFSATAVVEFGKCIRNGTKVALSEQQLVDCSTENGGCNGAGKVGLAFSHLASAGGQATAASYPYRAVQGTCNFARAVTGAVLSTRQPALYIKANDTLTMKTLLSRNRLFSIGIAVVNSFFSYKSGVYTDDSACNIISNILGYHAMTVVGYGSLNDVDYWVIRNSWGSSWGASGYVLFKLGTNQCFVEQWPVTTTVTA